MNARGPGRVNYQSYMIDIIEYFGNNSIRSCVLTSQVEHTYNIVIGNDFIDSAEEQ